MLGVNKTFENDALYYYQFRSIFQSIQSQRFWLFEITKEARECAIFYITLSSILVYWSDILCCTLVVKYPLTTATEIILSKIIRKLFGMHGQFYTAWFRIHKHQPDHCLDIFANKKFIWINAFLVFLHFVAVMRFHNCIFDGLIIK